MNDKECIHARKGHALVEIALADKQVTPTTVIGAVGFIDNVLKKLRMGSSRRNRYGDLRRRRRLLRALCIAAERFWSSS